MINVAICGVGRAGLEVIRTIRDSRKYNIVAGFCRNQSEKAGHDIGELSLTGKWVSPQRLYRRRRKSS